MFNSYVSLEGSPPKEAHIQEMGFKKLAWRFLRNYAASSAFSVVAFNQNHTRIKNWQKIQLCGPITSELYWLVVYQPIEKYESQLGK